MFLRDRNSNTPIPSVISRISSLSRTLDVAQLVYLVRNNQAIREVGSIITYEVVLVLKRLHIARAPSLCRELDFLVTKCVYQRSLMEKCTDRDFTQALY
ncbi:MAG TPA: hypothetical protein V6C90_17420 [Coleofasciculaceae cyanobacterium]